MMIDPLNVVLMGFIILAVVLILFVYFKDKLLLLLIHDDIKHNQRVESGVVQDYDIYHMSISQKAAAIIVAGLFLISIGFIFYRSLPLAMLLTPFSLLYPRFRKAELINKRKNELKLQFKDALQSLSSSLHAGKSFESAIKSAIHDLQVQYETDADIIQELEMIARKLESNETIESAFAAFAERSHVEEIQGFAEILELCKRSGGNLITAIKSSSEIISDKIEVLNDIQGILTAKKLEQKVLMVMPIVIILMLSMSAKEFMEPVFTLPLGRIVMTISMLLFGAAYFISSKITNIEV